MLYKEFCKTIKLARIEKGINQKDFAISIGLTQSNYCKIEKGNQEPSFLVLCKIIKYLDIDFNNLINNDKEESIKNYD